MERLKTLRRRKAEGAGYSVSSDSTSRGGGLGNSSVNRSVGTLEDKKRLLERYFPDNNRCVGVLFDLT